MTNAEKIEITVFLSSPVFCGIHYNLFLQHPRLQSPAYQMQGRGSTKFDVWATAWEHNGNLSPAGLWHMQLSWYGLLIYHQSSNENSPDNTYFEFLSGCYEATSPVLHIKLKQLYEDICLTTEAFKVVYHLCCLEISHFILFLL